MLSILRCTTLLINSLPSLSCLVNMLSSRLCMSDITLNVSSRFLAFLISIRSKSAWIFFCVSSVKSMQLSFNIESFSAISASLSNTFIFLYMSTIPWCIASLIKFCCVLYSSSINIDLLLSIILKIFFESLFIFIITSNTLSWLVTLLSSEDTIFFIELFSVKSALFAFLSNVDVSDNISLIIPVITPINTPFPSWFASVNIFLLFSIISTISLILSTSIPFSWLELRILLLIFSITCNTCSPFFCSTLNLSFNFWSFSFINSLKTEFCNKVFIEVCSFWSSSLLIECICWSKLSIAVFTALLIDVLFSSFTLLNVSWFCSIISSFSCKRFALLMFWVWILSSIRYLFFLSSSIVSAVNIACISLVISLLKFANLIGL